MWSWWSRVTRDVVTGDACVGTRRPTRAIPRSLGRRCDALCYKCNEHTLSIAHVVSSARCHRYDAMCRTLPRLGTCLATHNGADLAAFGVGKAGTHSLHKLLRAV